LVQTELERNGRVQVQRVLVEAPVRASRQRLELAFVQLVRNATQVAPAQGLVLQIRMELLDHDVRLWFEDDGPGVPSADVARIFQPGVSLRGGTGLGLATVRAVIEDESGGTVGYQERPGGGAAFVLTLPRAEREE